jgi:hypothetical protein
MDSRQACDDIESYIATEGPFDGVIAFSEGAIVAAGLILYKVLVQPEQQRTAPLFRCAIFFSGGTPMDPASFLKGEIRPVEATTYGEVINIPTAHIWGSNDTQGSDIGASLRAVCNAELRSTLIHQGGHEIPTPKDVDAFKKMVRYIRKTIDRAT